MSNWLDKIMPSKIRSESKQRTGVPEGLWKKCPKCNGFLYRPELDRNLNVCPKCEHHIRINARRRLEIFLDAKDSREFANDLEPVDRLKFKDTKRYKDRLSQAQKSTGEKDALVVMAGTVQEVPVVAVAFEFQFDLAHLPVGLQHLLVGRIRRVEVLRFGLEVRDQVRLLLASVLEVCDALLDRSELGVDVRDAVGEVLPALFVLPDRLLL